MEEQTPGVFPSLCWINPHRYYDNFTKPPEFSFGESTYGPFTAVKQTPLLLAVLAVI